MNPWLLLSFALAASVATGPQTRQIFSTPGTKTVTLTACNSSGCSSTTKTLTVLDPKPSILSLDVPRVVGSAERIVQLSSSLGGRPPLTALWTITSSSAPSLSLQGLSPSWTPTSLGSHQVLLRASNSSGVAFGGPVALSVVPSSFTDVSPAHWAFPAVELLVANGISAGCGLLNYCPELILNREQMALLLVRSIKGSQFIPPPASGTFLDVPASSFFAPYVEQIFRDGLTQGCSLAPLRYCPGNPVTRDQMAVFLLRAKYGPSYTPPPATGNVFDDVPPNAFAAAWIEKLAADGLTAGCETRRYCPGLPVNRAQIAAFLTRTFSLSHRPTPASFRATLCDVSPCSFPAGLPLSFALRVTGGLPTSFDYDWAGDGTYEETSPFPIEFHAYSLPGTYTPRVRLRAGSWSASLSHPAVVVRLADASQAPPAPSGVSAAHVGAVAPTSLDAPGTLWRTAFALRAASQRHTGFVVYRSANASSYRPVAVLPADLSRPLLLPTLPSGSSSNLYLVAFNASGFSSASAPFPAVYP